MQTNDSEISFKFSALIVLFISVVSICQRLVYYNTP